MSAKVNALRELREDLQRLGNFDIEGGIEETVGVGNELWAILQEAQRQFEAVKGIIREDVGSTPGTYTLTGSGGATCRVTVQRPRPIIRQGTDMDHVRQVIGTGFFNQLFMETGAGTYIPHPNFIERAHHHDYNVANALVSAVDLKTDPARVSFDRRS